MEVGNLLRHWRRVRGKSQLDLSFDAGVSSKHISFIETGRSQPSRDMVLTLGNALGLSVRDQSTLLEAAGYQAFPARPLDDPQLAELWRAFDTLLGNHPWPGWVLDRHWRVVRSNAHASALFAALFAPEVLARLATAPLSIVDALLDDALLRRCVRNWPEVAASVLRRLEGEGAGPAITAPLVEALRGSKHPDGPAPPLVPLTIDGPGWSVTLINLMAWVGTPRDVTVEGLRVELTFPADEASARVLRDLGHDAQQRA